MARSIKLDEIYFQMMAEIRTDPRISNTDLARKLNLSETAVRRRMSTLIEGGFLRMSATPNPTKLGFTLQVWTGMQVGIGHVSGVVERISELPEINYLAIVTGNYDIIFAAWFRDVDHLRSFLTEDIGQLEHVTKSDTYLILDVIASGATPRNRVATPVSDLSPADYIHRREPAE